MVAKEAGCFGPFQSVSECCASWPPDGHRHSGFALTGLATCRCRPSSEAQWGGAGPPVKPKKLGFDRTWEAVDNAVEHDAMRDRSSYEDGIRLAFELHEVRASTDRSRRLPNLCCNRAFAAMNTHQEGVVTMSARFHNIMLFTGAVLTSGCDRDRRARSKPRRTARERRRCLNARVGGLGGRTPQLRRGADPVGRRAAR